MTAPECVAYRGDPYPRYILLSLRSALICHAGGQEAASRLRWSRVEPSPAQAGKHGALSLLCSGDARSQAGGVPWLPLAACGSTISSVAELGSGFQFRVCAPGPHLSARALPPRQGTAARSRTARTACSPPSCTSCGSPCRGTPPPATQGIARVFKIFPFSLCKSLDFRTFGSCSFR